jgi:hypothetical protein
VGARGRRSDPGNYSAEQLGRDFGVSVDLVADVGAWDDEFQAVVEPDAKQRLLLHRALSATQPPTMRR